MIQNLWENILRRKNSESDIFHFLKKSFLFQDLGHQEIEFLSQLVHVRHYQSGEPIFRQGDSGVGMYLLVNGSVDIVMHDPAGEGSNELNGGIFITRLEKGDFFGELSLAEDPSYRSATAVCLTKSTLVGFFKPDLLQVVQRNPSTGNKIILRLAEILGRRLRETTDKVTELYTELEQLKTQAQGKKSEKHFTS